MILDLNDWIDKPKSLENEKQIFDAMKIAEEMLLPDLRQKFDMSNKAWDVSLKNLTKNQLLKVSKEGENLYVRIVK